MLTLIVFENYAALLESAHYRLLTEEPLQVTLRAMSVNPNLVRNMKGNVIDVIDGMVEIPPVHRRNIEQTIVYEQQF